jgi:hypothetical protein
MNYRLIGLALASSIRNANLVPSSRESSPTLRSSKATRNRTEHARHIEIVNPLPKRSMKQIGDETYRELEERPPLWRQRLYYRTRELI